MNKSLRIDSRMLRFFAVSSLFSLASCFAHPVTPSLFKQLNLENYMFGVALASMSFGNLLFSPFWGRMASRLSSRVVIMICCFGYAVGQLLFASAQTALQVVVIRFCTGIFIGGIFVGMLTYVVNTAPDETLRARYLVIQATVEGVSNAIGYFVGGMLGEISVQTSVLTQAGTLALCAVLFRLLCTNDRRETAPLPAGKAFFKEINPFGAFIQGRPMLTCAMGLVLGMGALQYFGHTCFDQSFNYYVIDQLHLSTGYNGVIKGAMGIVTLIANSTLCGWLMTRFGAHRAVGWVFAVCSLAMAAALSTAQLAPFLILSIIFYALNAISLPMLRNLTAEDGRRRQMDSNMVMSFYNAMKNLGSILGALLAGFTYMVTPKTPFICCILALLAAAALSLVYQRTLRRS